MDKKDKKLIDDLKKNINMGIMPVQSPDNLINTEPLIGFTCKCCKDEQVVQYYAKDSTNICDECLSFIGKLRKRMEALG